MLNPTLGPVAPARPTPSIRVRLVGATAALALLTACGQGAPGAEPPAADPPAEPTPSASADVASDAAPAAADTAAEPVLFAQDASDLAADPAVTYGVLDNGLRYAIMANDTPTGIAAVRLRFDHGSLNEADDQLGLAHFLEHMAFNGSENVPEGEMIKMLERVGLAFGPDTNAYTSFDETVYQLDLPNVDDETVDTAFFIMRETADKLLIAQDAVDSERGVILSEERVRNTFGLRAAVARWGFMFPDALFPTRLPIGEREVIETAPAERLRALYDAEHRPDEAFFVVVGDVDVAAMEARIAETFGDWERPDEPAVEPDLGTAGPRGFDAGVFIDPDVPTQVSLDRIFPYTDRPDTVAEREASVIRGIATGALNRRFARIAREAGSPVLAGGSSFGGLFETADVANVTVTARPEAWREALAIAEQETRRALEFGFTADEVAEQVANVRASLESAADGADTRESRGLANAIAGSFADGSVFTHPSGGLERFNAYADAITPERVTAAFREAWGDGEPVIFVTHKDPDAVSEAAIEEAYTQSLTVPVEAPIAREALVFAYDDFGDPGVVAERDTIADLAIERVRFANNVRLGVKQTDFEDATVRVRVRVGGGGLEQSADDPGLDIALDTAFTAGGLGQHSFDDIQTVMAGTTIDLNFTTGGDAFTFGAAVDPDDLSLQLKAIAAFIADPGFRPEAIDRFRRLVPPWHDTLDATPGGVRARDVARLLRSGDARFGIPDADTMLAYELDDLRRLVSRALESGAIEIGIVGDVDPETAIAAVAESLGALDERPAEPLAFAEARQVTFPQSVAEPITLTHAGEPDQAQALIYWPTTDDDDIETVRAVRMLERVFDLRLIEEVREKAGATYSPNAGSLLSSVYDDYGYVSVGLDLKPEDIAGFFDVVDDIAAGLGADITADDLQRARQPILEIIEEREENNGHWLNLADSAWSDEEALERHRTAADGYAAITPEIVETVARDYLDPARVYRIQIVPSRAPEPETDTDPAPAAE